MGYVHRGVAMGVCAREDMLAGYVTDNDLLFCVNTALCTYRQPGSLTEWSPQQPMRKNAHKQIA